MYQDHFLTEDEEDEEDDDDQIYGENNFGDAPQSPDSTCQSTNEIGGDEQKARPAKSMEKLTSEETCNQRVVGSIISHTYDGCRANPSKVCRTL